MHTATRKIGTTESKAKPRRTYWRDDTKESIECLTRLSSERGADLISSLTEGGLHAPTLDIDMMMSTEWFEDGSTEYVFMGPDAPRAKYLALIKTARDLGLLSAGYYQRTASQLERERPRVVRAPALKLSVPSSDVASSTEGHSHLYIDAELSWQEYHRLLVALEGARILQGRFYEMAMLRKMTLLLTPRRNKAEMKARLGTGYSS